MERQQTVNSVLANVRQWGQRHSWSEDGDEWKGQAIACGVPYEEWKEALVSSLIDPFVTPESTVLEIGPGHGRWSEYFAARSKRLILAELNENCLEHCRTRFAQLKHIDYRQIDGSSLPMDLSNKIDLVWSYDVFVHIARADIRKYLRDVARVLVPGGKAVIHHANRRHTTLWLGFLRQLGSAGTRLYRLISMGSSEWADGWRSEVSARLFSQMAQDAGLTVVKQINSWGEKGKYGIPRFNDRVTILSKPCLS